MDEQQVLKKLLAAQKALDQAIAAMRPKPAVANASDPICLYCEEPILPGDKLKRGIHDACYQDARILVKDPNTPDTWKSLEEEGFIPPPAKRGRPKVRRKATAAATKQADQAVKKSRGKSTN